MILIPLYFIVFFGVLTLSALICKKKISRIPCFSLRPASHHAAVVECKSIPSSKFVSFATVFNPNGVILSVIFFNNALLSGNSDELNKNNRETPSQSGEVSGIFNVSTVRD